MPRLTKKQFYAAVALNRLDKGSDEEALDIAQDWKEAVAKEEKKARTRKRTPEQAKKHKNDQRARAQARDPKKYAEKKKRHREAYKAKKQAEAEEAQHAHHRFLAELLELTEE